MTTLPIGINSPLRKCRGFTLVELMLSVAILAVGILGVYRPYLASIDHLTYTENRLEAMPLITQKVWEIRQQLKRSGSVPALSSGVLMGGREVFRYRLNKKPLTADRKLEEGVLTVHWSQGNRQKKIDRTLYFLHSHEAQA